MTRQSPTNLTVNISITPCHQAAAIGYDTYQVNRLAVRISQFWLNKGARLLFGHDWRDDGVMQAIAEYAEGASSDGNLRAHKSLNEIDYLFTDSKDIVKPWRLLNIDAQLSEREPMRQYLNQQGLNAERDTNHLLRVITLPELKRAIVSKTRAVKRSFGMLTQSDAWLETDHTRLWVMRKSMTALLDPGIRICLCGKSHGHSGLYPGIIEEAYFALTENKPLYLIGGYGGATREVCLLLSNRESRLHAERIPVDDAHSNVHTSEPDLQRYGIDNLNIPQYIAEFDMNQFCKNNGLSLKDNMRLFGTTDIELALGLISKGVTRLSLNNDNQQNQLM